MGFSNSKKQKIWERYFGNDEDATDVFGRGINIKNFAADHIYPQALKGSDDIKNGIPLHKKSSEEKAYYLEGTIKGHDFEVKNVFNKIGKLWVDGKKVSK